MSIMIPEPVDLFTTLGEYTLFSVTYRILTKIDYVLGKDTSLHKFQKIGVT